MLRIVAQGLLDFKFLNDRFQKGKEKIQEFTEKKHKLMALDSLVLGHGTIVQMQQQLGSSALPSSTLENLNPVSFYLSLMFHLMSQQSFLMFSG